MKKAILTVILALTAAMCLNAQQPKLKSPAKGTPFFFVQMSDPQLGFREEDNATVKGEALLKATVEAINRLAPPFVIVTGDLVNENKSDDQISKYKKLIGGIDKNIAVFQVPGNHDIGDVTEEDIRTFISNYGFDRFAFKYAGCAFIGINTNIIAHKDRAEMEMQQYEWLEKQLKKYRKCDKIFVFGHYPVILKSLDEKEEYFNFSMPMRSRYMDLFKKYGVDAYISGHLHENSYAETEGIRFYTTGASGLPLGKGFSGFAVISVDKDGYEYNYTSAADAVKMSRP